MYKIDFRQHQLERQGLRFRIDMDISILCRHIGPDQSIVLTPTLIYREHSRELPLVIVSGSRRHKSFKGMLRWFKPYCIYKALRGDNDSGLLCRYRLCIPFEEWMKEARISLMGS